VAVVEEAQQIEDKDLVMGVSTVTLTRGRKGLTIQILFKFSQGIGSCNTRHQSNSSTRFITE
jgi:hypothetical protein